MTGDTSPSHRRTPRPGALRLRTTIMAVLCLLAGPSFADRGTGADPADLCEAAAARAASESGVPLAVLRAITLTETGRRRNGSLRPWPWTVNMEGKGVWFDNPDEARAYVFRHHSRGARSYDVGCFQLNYRWHGKAFASVEEMFDPLANARYAARFLSDLHAETGSWSRAAGAYHSRTPHYAQRYRKRFDEILARLEGAPPPDVAMAEAAPADPAAAGGPAPEAPRRTNSFPLLVRADAPSALGSLVPLARGAGRSLFDALPVGAEGADAG